MGFEDPRWQLLTLTVLELKNTEKLYLIQFNLMSMQIFPSDLFLFVNSKSGHY